MSCSSEAAAIAAVAKELPPPTPLKAEGGLAVSKLCLCLCSFRKSSFCSCSRSLSRCISSLLRGVGGGDFFPLAISNSSALHFLILERGEREEEAEGGGEEGAGACAALALPAGLQLARGGVEPERAPAAAAAEGERRRPRCLPAEAAVAEA